MRGDGSTEARKRRSRNGSPPRAWGRHREPARESAEDRLTSGYRADADALIHKAVFEQCCDNMILVRDIEIYSLCEHHMLPFFGRCHVAYVPTGKVFGVSKIARLADMYARRLQIQERLTAEIAETIMERVKPRGVGVVIEARHLCMMMRGVEKQNSVLTTSAVLGSFKESHATRNEFLSLISRPRP
ncbi:MAG TPA: GTP cyclohydrolase I FolE [Planctomycetota bacterium]|nr:GTP cyclohydrolase I FolE [Planctomycetota bacterium]